MNTEEIISKLKELQTKDITEDNCIANGLNSLINEIDSLGGALADREREVQTLKDANISLKAKNFDLLSQVGTQEVKQESKPLSVEEAVHNIFKL